jgi:KUP system potassium uptake protein
LDGDRQDGTAIPAGVDTAGNPPRSVAPIRAAAPPPITVPQKTPGKASLVLGALGIVFGDLGTSPLYTYQTIVKTAGGHPSAADAMGLLSLVVWALIISVSVKYCVLVMRADNHGEGGILALLALVSSKIRQGSRGGGVLIGCGLFGAALIYGDGMITPAISVLSALEGVDAFDKSFTPYVLPAALAILFLLFVVQPRGTAAIGRIFGPVMVAWFVTIGVLGLLATLRHPEVASALDPLDALDFLVRHGWSSFLVLGGVFLAITGGEALYADMGHFGRFPIRLSWYGLVLPALLLCYAGQTALLLGDPGLSGNPFFKLPPQWAILPLVGLATLATIIASQAIITGAFSLTRQAMQLGWFPGLHIRQTSADEYGQIYVPFVNWVMMLGTLGLAYGFGSSDALSGAYGAAVSTTMLLTTALLYNAMRDVWGWPMPVALLTSAVFLGVDLAFFAANMLKLREGGWVPLLIGAVIFLIMATWHRGVEAVHDIQEAERESPEEFLTSLKTGRVARVPGTAVFLSRSGWPITPLIVRHVAQMKALQDIVISLTVRFEKVPRIPAAHRAETQELHDGLWSVAVRFGFLEVPNLASALSCAKDQGCPLDLDDAVYFVARDEVTPGEHGRRMPAWRRMLFGFMYRNAVHAADRFDLPANKLLEVGRQIAL